MDEKPIETKAKVKIDKEALDAEKAAAMPKAKAEVDDNAGFDKPAKGFARVFSKIRHEGKPAVAFVDVALGKKTKNGTLLLDIYKTKLKKYEDSNSQVGKVFKIVNG